MSKCMTIADETVDQKDICIDIAPKEIVEFILEEALLSVFIVSDKGCSRIGDSNITDEFRQQYDQISNQKDFEQVEPSQAQPAANKDSTLNSRENLDRVAVQAKGNLEQIIHSFVKEEEKAKPLNDCQIISEDLLADNELQIKNGQILLEKNNTEKNTSDSAREEYFDKKDVIKDEKIEIEYFNKGQLNRIYVPLNLTSSKGIDLDYESKQKEEDAPEKEKEEMKKANSKEDTERPFTPFTTEELRQVWESGNSSLVGRWEGNTLAQKQEVVRIMEELSSVQMFSDSFADPNRPRACSIGEEDVKKMTKEIEDMNFTQSHVNSENSVSCFSENQCTDLLSKCSGGRSRNDCSLSLTSGFTCSKHREFERDQKHDILSTEVEIQSQTYNVLSNIKTDIDSKEQTYINNFDNETSNEENKSQDELNSGFSTQPQTDNINGMEDSKNRRNSELFQNETTDPRKSDTNVTNSEKTNLTPDLDAVSIQKSSPVIKKSQNIDIPLNVNNHQIQQGTMSWNGMKWGSKEALCTLNSNSFLEENHWERILVNYNPINKEGEGKTERNDAENFSQEPESWMCQSNTTFVKIPNGEDFNLSSEKINERLGESLVNPLTNFDKSEERICRDEDNSTETTSEKFLRDDKTFDTIQTTMDEQESQKVSNEEDTSRNIEFTQEQDNSCQNSQTQINGQTTSENELSEASETLVSGSQKFKLHSQKMYMNAYHEPACQVPNEFNLTESEEAFIDFSENVIQVIDPPDNSADEDSNVISFSLLPEATNFKSATPDDTDNKSELSFKIEDFSESETESKKVHSGMTTIGPIKNLDYDPKDLTAPEIDYGKMTRITSSRQLARDMGLLNSENPALSVKIIEEDDSDDNTSLTIEDDHLDRTSLINRDIASLTKVQKVREVMSHQAKPEEEFEDEESLPRPRLDLKDVESMTDERYKYTDVSIPLLSLDIAERNMDAEKELIESMGLVISGLTNACFYEEESEDNADIHGDYSTLEKTKSAVESSSTGTIDKQNSKTESLNAEDLIPRKSEKEKSIVEFTDETGEDISEKEVLESKHSRTDRRNEGFENQRHSTLGNVFKKASMKFFQKELEFDRRYSKSLPRDTNKITSSNSIRSILDDCHSSATNMLKKSRSLLKNTESIFKSISQSMVATDRNSGSNPNQKKLSPSESDVSTIERKFSGFFKKEDLTKAKNIIKNKVEKTFKSSDVGSFSDREPEIVSEQKDLRVVVKNEENLRIDRIENFKKLLPKSPLVYKSQFVKSQMNFQNPPENEAAVNPTAEETVNGNPVENNGSPIPMKDKEFSEEPQRMGINSPEKLEWINKAEGSQLSLIENPEPQQPDFIVMETIQGLPASDLESPSSEKENLNVENTQTKKAENDSKKIEASNSLQILTDRSRDVAPSFPDTDEEKMATKTPSERKIKTKKKKFTARFRSFWCSAFGRAKTPPKKGDLS